ncbi:MAG: 5'-nucleotidase C-terminal domain-containing protein [Gemmatimonadota bacterium]
MLLPILLALSMQAPDTAHVVIVATTDVHGHATAWDYLGERPFAGGLTRAASVVDSLRRQYPGEVVLVDAGDLLQGDAFAAYYGGAAQVDPHPVVDAMGAMAYDAATPGDHDFDWGVPFMLRAMRSATFPFVSGNIYTLPADTLVFPSYVVVPRSGVRVGITGFTTPSPMVWNREMLRGKARISAIGGAAQRVLRALRPDVDLLIVLMHAGMDGSSSYDTAGVGPEHAAASLAGNSTTHPDVVVLGHSHGEMADSVLNGVHFVQPGKFAQSLSIMHVTLQRGSEGWKPIHYKGQILSLAHVEQSPSLTRRLVARDDAVRHWLLTPVGNVSVDMPATTARTEPTPLMNYLGDLELRHAGTDLASTPVFDTHIGLHAGEATLGQVLAWYPSENTLIGIRITGKQLKAYLEQSARYFVNNGQGRITLNEGIPGTSFDVVTGAEYAIDLRLPPGDRIRGLSVRGKPVDPSDQFTLALPSMRQSGGGGFSMLAGAPVVYDHQENIRDLIVADMHGRGVLRADDFSASSWHIVPDEAARAARRLFAPTPEPVQAPPPRDTLLLRIFAMSDLHGALIADPADGADRPTGGMPAMKRLMDSLTSACRCADLRLDGGDAMQGALASNLEFGRSAVAALNLMGIDAAVVGSHDFDWGIDTLQQRMAEAHYPWLVANLVDSATGRRPDWGVPYKILTAGRLRVAVVGYLTPETNSTVRGDLLKGLHVAGPGSLAEAIAAARSEHPDLVIVLAHEGADCHTDAPRDCTGPLIDLARSLDSGSVDLIVAGHNLQVANTVVNGIRVVGPGANAGNVAVVDVVQTLVDSRELHARLIPLASAKIGSDTAMQRLVTGFRQRSDSMISRPIATLSLPAPRRGAQYALGNLVADAFRNALRTDFGVVNSAAISGDLSAGSVTYAQVFRVLPDQDELVRLRLNGRELRALLEDLLRNGSPEVHISGLQVFYDSTRETGKRVREVRLPNGRRLEDHGSYTLATNVNAGAGENSPLSRIQLARERTGVTDLDALIAYLRRLPQPVPIPEDPRFIVGH